MIMIKWLKTQIEEFKRFVKKEKKLTAVKTKVEYYYDLENSNLKFNHRIQLS